MNGQKCVHKMWRLFILFLLVADTKFWANGVEATFAQDDSSYFAGVVEMIPAVKGTTKERLNANRDQIISIIQSNLTKDLDIIVFPENVLNNMDYRTYLPNPILAVAPCDTPNYDFFLTTLSCAVRSRGLYVVLNLYEKEQCDSGTDADGPCGKDDTRTFNTNVVFDRKGHIISRYRKTHLYRYEWYKTSVLRDPELAYFSTDFGVTFGHFICFDMLFYVPAMRLVRDFNITDYLYPTYWFNELPFLTAVQLQESWAFANDVNLLAADGCSPQTQNTGSGIYAGRLGRLKAVIQEEQKTIVLTARVPKRNPNRKQVESQKPFELPPRQQSIFTPERKPNRFTHLAMLRDYNVDIFSTELLPLTNIDEFIGGVKQVCHDTFCCDFSMSVESIESDGQISVPSKKQLGTYRYRLGAYSGDGTTFQRIDRSAQSVCAVFACTGEELNTCGQIFPANVEVSYTHYFRNLTVRGIFLKAENRLITPSTLDGQIMPFFVDEYSWTETKNDQSTVVSIDLLTPKTDLLTFGIWANYYTNVVSSHNLKKNNTLKMQPKSANSGATLILATYLVYVATAFLFFLAKCAEN